VGFAAAAVRCTASLTSERGDAVVAEAAGAVVFAREGEERRDDPVADFRAPEEEEARFAEPLEAEEERFAAPLEVFALAVFADDADFAAPLDAEEDRFAAAPEDFASDAFAAPLVDFADDVFAAPLVALALSFARAVAVPFASAPDFADPRVAPLLDPRDDLVADALEDDFVFAADRLAPPPPFARSFARAVAVPFAAAPLLPAPRVAVAAPALLASPPSLVSDAAPRPASRFALRRTGRVRGRPEKTSPLPSSAIDPSLCRTLRRYARGVDKRVDME
jgi:hypothetical protein